MTIVKKNNKVLQVFFFTFNFKTSKCEFLKPNNLVLPNSWYCSRRPLLPLLWMLWFIWDKGNYEHAANAGCVRTVMCVWCVGWLSRGYDAPIFCWSAHTACAIMRFVKRICILLTKLAVFQDKLELPLCSIYISGLKHSHILATLLLW